MGKNNKQQQKEPANVVPRDTVQFMERIGIVLQKLDNVEDSEVQDMVSAALDDARGIEFDVCCHTECSRTLELCIRFATQHQVLELARGVQNKAKTLALHASGSHVLEALITRVIGLVAETEETTKELHVDASIILEHISGALRAQWMVLASNRYGSKVMRTFLSLLTSGYTEETPSLRRVVNSSGIARQVMSTVLDEPGETSFKDILSAILRRFIERGEQVIPQYTVHKYASSVIVALLRLSRLLGGNDSLNLIGLVFNMKEGVLDREHISALMRNAVSSLVVDTVMNVAPSSFLHEFYANCLRNQLVEVAKDEYANYILQRYLAAQPNEAEVTEILNEIGPIMQEIMFGGKCGVVYHIVVACEPYPNLQKMAIRHLTAAVGDKELVAGLLDVTEDTLPALVLSVLLRYKTECTENICKGVSRLSPEHVKKLAVGVGGSRALESFFRSGATQRLKHRIVKSVVGHWAGLALHPTGSHVVETAYEHSDRPATREVIVSELAPHVAQLKKSPHGIKVLNKCHVTDYVEKERTDWLEGEEKRVAQMGVFDDLLNDGEAWLEDHPAGDGDEGGVTDDVVRPTPDPFVMEVVGREKKEDRKRSRGSEKEKKRRKK